VAKKTDDDFLGAVQRGLLFGAAMLALVLPPSGIASIKARTSAKPLVSIAAPATVPAAPVAAAKFAEFDGHVPTPEVEHIANWIVDSSDNRGMPFMVVDKKDARVWVFTAQGKVHGVTPALMGSAVGDHSVPGIGEREIMDILPEERTTPAGRFKTAPGRNTYGEDIVWIDYSAAISMHRVRPKVASERRLERLASPEVDDNRISFGCINLPKSFYENVVSPMFGKAQGMAYVLPETITAQQMFASYDVKEKAQLLAKR
jgi:hypothetical protein